MCGEFANTGMAAVECDPPSSRPFRFPQDSVPRGSDISLSPKRLKTSESSSENLKLGENPGDEQTAQVRR